MSSAEEARENRRDGDESEVSSYDFASGEEESSAHPSTLPAVPPPPIIEFNPELPLATFPSVSTDDAAAREHVRRVSQMQGAAATQFHSFPHPNQNVLANAATFRGSQQQVSQALHGHAAATQANTFCHANQSVLAGAATSRGNQRQVSQALHGHAAATQAHSPPLDQTNENARYTTATQAHSSRSLDQTGEKSEKAKGKERAPNDHHSLAQVPRRAPNPANPKTRDTPAPRGNQPGPYYLNANTFRSNDPEWKSFWWSSDDEILFQREMRTEDDEPNDVDSRVRHHIPWNDIQPGVRVEIINGLGSMGYSRDHIIKRLKLSREQLEEMMTLTAAHNRRVKDDDRDMRVLIAKIDAKLKTGKINKSISTEDDEVQQLHRWAQHFRGFQGAANRFSMWNSMPQSNFGAVINRYLQQIRQAGEGPSERVTRMHLLRARRFLRSKNLDPGLAGCWRRELPDALDSEPETQVPQDDAASMSGDFNFDDSTQTTPLPVPVGTTPRHMLSSNVQAPTTLRAQAANMMPRERPVVDRNFTLPPVLVQAGVTPEYVLSSNTQVPMTHNARTANAMPRPRTVVDRNLTRDAAARWSTARMPMNPSAFVPDPVYAPQAIANQPAALSVRRTQSFDHMMDDFHERHWASENVNTPYYHQRQESRRRQEQRSRGRILLTGAPSPVLQDMQVRARRALSRTLGTPAPIARMMPIVPSNSTPPIRIREAVRLTQSSPAPTAAMVPVGQRSSMPPAKTQAPEPANKKRGASSDLEEVEFFDDAEFPWPAPNPLAAPNSKRQKLTSSAPESRTPSFSLLGGRRASNVSLADSVHSQASAASNSSRRTMRSAAARSLPNRFLDANTEMLPTGYGHIDDETQPHSPRTFEAWGPNDNNNNPFSGSHNGAAASTLLLPTDHATRAMSTYPEPPGVPDTPNYSFDTSEFDACMAQLSSDFSMDNVTTEDVVATAGMTTAPSSAYSSFATDAMMMSGMSDARLSSFFGDPNAVLPDVGAKKKRGRPRKEDPDAPKAPYVKRKGSST